MANDKTEGMTNQNINWFPGHMAKTRRLIAECLPLVAAVIEILDARIPESSQNPEIDRICASKPRIILLSKTSLANENATKAWRKHFQSLDKICIPCDFITGFGISDIVPAVRTQLAEKIAKNEQKGMSGKAIRAMVVGIPNVGKSSFINKFAAAKKAKVENRPGVTLAKQWIKCQNGIELLDTPGVLWPKFDERTVAENLAITGAIKDTILDTEEIATVLCSRLARVAPRQLAARYNLDESDIENLPSYELFELIGKKRGLLIKGGNIDSERTSLMLLDEFRSAKIGRISLEVPQEG